MTSDTPTTPPPGPLPSVLPESERPAHIEAHHLGRALAGLDAVNAYIRGRVDAEFLDLTLKREAYELRTRDEFRAEMRERLDRIEAILKNLTDGLLTEAQKVVSLREENRRANVARCEDCPIRDAL